MTAPTLTAPNTRREWLARSAELTAVVDSLADRRDLTVQITDEPVPAPGTFSRGSAAITLDATKLLPEDTNPAHISFADPRDLAAHPIVAGVLSHEVGHADHTLWAGHLGPHPQWVRALEEPRIETIMARTRPRCRLWMNAAVAHLLGTVDPQNAAEAARTLILLGGRLLGDVIDPAPALDLDAVCAPWLTAEQVAVITHAVDQALTLTDGDTAGMAKCAALIADVLDTDDNPTDSDSNHIPGTSGTPTQGTGDPNQAPDNNANNQATPGAGGSGPASDTTTGRPDTAAVAALNAALADRAAEAQQAMNAAAGNITASPAAQQRAVAAQHRADTISQQAKRARGNTHTITYRQPTPVERKTREQLRRNLRKAADRGYDVHTRAHTAPPGRLVNKELVRRAAERATGQTPTATPWTTKQRRRRPQPTLRVGIAADISPSQDAVTDPVGVIAWLLSVLPRDRGGRVETVTWHTDAAMLPTGRGDLIPVARTAGTSTGLPAALQALDGSLHLNASRDGARLVVVITDAHLPNAQAINAELRRLLDTGVKVLWLLSQNNPGQMTPPHGVTVASVTDPSTLAHTIAAAAIEALSTH